MQTLRADQLAYLTKVLIVGIDKYEAPDLTNLQYANSSGNELSNALSDPNGCRIPKEHIYNPSENKNWVEKKEIIKSLNELVEKSSEQEIFIFFFAGHGMPIGQEVYLCASDSSSSDVVTCISATEISDILEGSLFKGVLLITDCCHGSGMAERNPTFFQSRANSSFRIVLSSAALDQLSYEFDDIKGTIFSKILIGIVSGLIVVGENPGEIYFTEMLEGIQHRLHEELIAQNLMAYSQTAIFFGSFSSDPLIFLHKDLTFAEIEVKREKYSKAYVRKRVRQSAIAFIAAVTLIIGSYYTYLDRSAYIARYDDRIAIYLGHPEFTGFGFPKLYWQSDMPATAMSALDGQEWHIIPSEFSKNPVEYSIATLNSPYKEMLLLRDGQEQQARAGLLNFLLGEGKYSADAGKTTQLFAELAKEQDVAMLIDIFSLPRVDVKIGVIEGLMKIAPEEGYKLLMSAEAPLGDRDFARRLLSSMFTYVKGDTEHVIEALLKSKATFQTKDLTFSAAIRLGAKLSNQALWHALLEPHILYDDSLIRYMEASGISENWVIENKQRILEILKDEAENNTLKRTRVILLLSNLEDNILKLDFTPFLDVEDEFVGSAAAVAAIRHQQISISELTDQILSSPYFLDQYVLFEKLPPTIALRVLKSIRPVKRGLGTSAHILNSLRGQLDTEAVPYLREMAKYEDPNDISGPFQSYAIEELCKLDSGFDPTPWLGHESEEVVGAAYECRASRNPTIGEEDAIALLKSVNADLGRDYFLKYEPSKRALRKLSEIINESSDAGVKAAEIVSIYGTLDEVLRLLLSEKENIRDAAIEYSAANPNFLKLARHLSELDGPAAAESRYRLQYGLNWRRRIDEVLSTMELNDAVWHIETELQYGSPLRGAIIYFLSRVEGRTTKDRINQDS